MGVIKVADKLNDVELAKKQKRKKAKLWSLLWANVAMLIVVGATLAFQYYTYTQKLKHATSVIIEINPFLMIGAYIVGMLILWRIIYKYETKELDVQEDPYQNHNIYF